MAKWIVSRERKIMPAGLKVSGIIEIKQGYSVKEFTKDEKDKIRNGVEELLCEINSIQHRLVPKATLHLVYAHRTSSSKPVEELRRGAELLFNETVDVKLEKYALRGWRDRIKFHPIFLHKQEWR